MRFIRIANNNKKISNEAFKLQIITTVSQSRTSTGTWSMPTRT